MRFNLLFGHVLRIDRITVCSTVDWILRNYKRQFSDYKPLIISFVAFTKTFWFTEAIQSVLSSPCHPVPELQEPEDAAFKCPRSVLPKLLFHSTDLCGYFVATLELHPSETRVVHTSTSTFIRAANGSSRRFHNHGEGPC